MNTSKEIDVWCGKAASLTKKLTDGFETFTELSESYEGMRDKGFKDEHKARIDAAYSALHDAKQAFCALRSGGGKRKTRRYRKH